MFAQRALFHPKGLLGQLYWWSVYPFHGIVFGGMQRNIARAAETAERARTDRRVEPPRRRIVTGSSRNARTTPAAAPGRCAAATPSRCRRARAWSARRA